MSRVALRILGCACVVPAVLLGQAGTALAAADQGPARPEPPAAAAHPLSLDLTASGGLGFARERPELPWRRVPDARASAAYLGTPGFVFELHALYQSYYRSYRTPGLLGSGLPETSPEYKETRIDLGGFIGWDPLHTWQDRRSARAGFVVIVGELDLDQFANPIAPIVGFEPGGGARAYVRLLGPLELRGGGVCQWVTNLSPHASTVRFARGRPVGTWRYDLKAVLGLFRGGDLEAGYTGESFAFEFESTQAHSFVIGGTLHV
jgi:hypothetical protein